VRSRSASAGPPPQSSGRSCYCRRGRRGPAWWICLAGKQQAGEEGWSPPELLAPALEELPGVGGAPRRGGAPRHGQRRPRQAKAEATGAPRAGRWREIYQPPNLPTFVVFGSAAEKRPKGRQQCGRRGSWALRQILAGGGAPMVVYCKLIQSSLLFLFTDCSCLSQSFTERQSKTEAENEGLLSSFQAELDHSLGVLHRTVVGSVCEQRTSLESMNEHMKTFQLKLR
jgi:hypothetical protein